jgi:hypothetical protein
MPIRASNAHAVFAPDRARRCQYHVASVHESAGRPPPALYLDHRRGGCGDRVSHLIRKSVQDEFGCHAVIVAETPGRLHHPNGQARTTSNVNRRRPS